MVWEFVEWHRISKLGTEDRQVGMLQLIHLSSANDTLKGEGEMAEGLSCVLLCPKLVFRNKLHECKTILARVAENMTVFPNNYGSRVDFLSTFFLGLPFGSSQINRR